MMIFHVMSVMYVSLDSVIGIMNKGCMVWGLDYGRGKGFFLLPHKKKTVQITNLDLVPKLRMNEATGPSYMPSWC